ncbi:glycosyltransferase [Natronorubrum bangense]|uniref:Group 1 glycosyl transferase n=1 Tax=Natronorubrum bangense JCM 10635 TaxID=1227500 RepID=L9VZL1_9EURY|nr:glycosyltransferase [Natronorubrum bangense]ELY42655.1 group 1 glycosyl transferase [Natronorubrum bangense JCM 10635]
MSADRSSSQISLFVYSLQGGGAQKMMVNIANELSYRGYDVEMILVQATGPYEHLVDDTLTISEIGGANTFQILYNLWGHLRSSDTDVLLSTMEIPNIVSVLATRPPNPIPTVLRIANINSKKEREGKYKAIPTLKRLTYPRAEAIVTISDGVAEDLSEITGIDTKEMSTVYNPAYDPAIPTKATESIDHEWLNDDDKRVAIGVGNMKPQKDFATLLRAVHQVNQNEDLYLVILGRGDLKSDLESLAEKLEINDRVSFPGFVDNPYAYMARADVFVLSSAWEGFGNVIVEAMACGTSIVCTDCPGGPAEILENGRYGPLVPVGNDQAMAEAIKDVLTDPTNLETLTARAEEFSIENIVDQYERILCSVAN